MEYRFTRHKHTCPSNCVTFPGSESRFRACFMYTNARHSTYGAATARDSVENIQDNVFHSERLSSLVAAMDGFMTIWCMLWAHFAIPGSKINLYAMISIRKQIAHNYKPNTICKSLDLCKQINSLILVHALVCLAWYFYLTRETIQMCNMASVANAKHWQRSTYWRYRLRNQIVSN